MVEAGSVQDKRSFMMELDLFCHLVSNVSCFQETQVFGKDQ